MTEKCTVSGAGPSVVVTGLGVYRFSPEGRMYLESMHPGVTLEEVRENTGWDLTVADDLEQTQAPSSEELRLVRDELDPEGIYSL